MKSSNAQENISQSSVNTSVADEILRFKELLDSGIITEEEFEGKKAASWIMSFCSRNFCGATSLYIYCKILPRIVTAHVVLYEYLKGSFQYV